MFVLYVGYALVFVAIFLIARVLLKEEESRAAQESLDESKSKESSNTLVKWLRPFFRQYLVPMVRGKPFWNKSRDRYRRKLISAGLKNEFTPDEFIAFKLINILFFPLIGGMMNALDLINLSIPIIVVAAVVGWFYPDLWIRSRINERKKQIKKAMPFIVDLLALSTEAGLDFVGAMQKVVEKAAPSPLVEEFSQVLKDIKVGSSRNESLREMAARIDMPEVGSFVAILISADQMGASIGKTLRQQSEAIRNERFMMAERAGALAAQKLMIPTIFIVLPAVFIMIIGPFALGFVLGGGQ